MKGVSLSKKTEQERLRLLYAPMLANQIIGSLMVAVVLVMLFYQHASWWVLIPWILLVTGAVGYHVWLVRSFTEIKQNQDFSIHQWEQKFLLGVGLSAAVWGSAAVLFAIGAATTQLQILALIITGVSVVAIKLLSPSQKAMAIYAGLAVLPLLLLVVFTAQWLGIPLLAYLFIQMYISYTNGIKFKHDYYTSQSMAFASRQRELKLRKRDERHRIWVKQSADPIVLLTEEKILLANPAAIQKLGFDSKAQMLKIHPRKLLSAQAKPEQIQSIIRAAREALSSQGAYRFQWSCLQRGGQSFPAEISMTAIPFKQGEAYFCVLRDLTAFKADHEKLQQQADLAKQEIQAQSAYYEHISHAVFTPLNGVLGHSNMLLQNNNLDRDQLMRTRVIKRSAENLLGVFNDVLDVTKLDAGTLQLVEQSFDLRALLESFIAIAAERAEAKGLQLKHHIDAKMQPYYKGDANRITQILEQLFSNALKHTEQGEIKLLAKMVKTNKAGAMLRFDVIDTGPGVKKSQQAHLFDRYGQADGTVKGQVGGTGLGLSLAQGLAQLVGGEVGYTQHKGHGAHFWLKIRLNKAPAVKPKPKPNEAKQKGIKTFAARVLVVDDNRTSLMVAKGTLEVFGLTIDLVNTGPEALYMLREHDYDLVFMDCLMPKLDGYQTTQKIRSLSSRVRNPKIPIIAMTSNDQEGDREICLEAGMNDYITKPIDIRVIQQMLQFWLLKQ